MRAVAVLFASAAGIAVYLGVFNFHMTWVLIPLATAAIVGLLLLVAGRRLMDRHPVLAVRLIDALALTSLASLPPAQRDPLARLADWAHTLEKAGLLSIWVTGVGCWQVTRCCRRSRSIGLPGGR